MKLNLDRTGRVSQELSEVAIGDRSGCILNLVRSLTLNDAAELNALYSMHIGDSFLDCCVASIVPFLLGSRGTPAKGYVSKVWICQKFIQPIHVDEVVGHASVLGQVCRGVRVSHAGVVSGVLVSSGIGYQQSRRERIGVRGNIADSNDVVG